MVQFYIEKRWIFIPIFEFVIKTNTFLFIFSQVWYHLRKFAEKFSPLWAVKYFINWSLKRCRNSKKELRTSQQTYEHENTQNILSFKVFWALEKSCALKIRDSNLGPLTFYSLKFLYHAVKNRLFGQKAAKFGQHSIKITQKYTFVKHPRVNGFDPRRSSFFQNMGPFSLK